LQRDLPLKGLQFSGFPYLIFSILFLIKQGNTDGIKRTTELMNI